MVRIFFQRQIFTTISVGLLAATDICTAAPTHSFPALKLAHSAHGEDAIRSLVDKLPAVAAFYRKSPEQLREMFRRDTSLNLDRSGRLFYTCQIGGKLPIATGAPSANGPVVASIAPLSQTFLLHSKLGSSRTIYLDFDGHTLAANAWTDDNNGGTNIIAPAWDTDGDPGVFSASEQTAIQQIWLRVAEDFAPFDVDVTTEFPGEAALTRNNNGDQIYGTRALVSAIGDYFGDPGGVAYVGVFDVSGDYYKPALIFPENLGNSEKSLAEAISHEVGHNLGLEHDGTSAVEYFRGHGNWAPIMGVGYYEPISQWSQGEFTDANNTENDLAIITSNGVNYRTDDYGNTNNAAFALGGNSTTNSGIIERTGDADFFSFSTLGGTVQIAATIWERGANLHLRVSVYGSGGVLVTNLEATDTTSGVQAVNLSPVLTNGTYYVAIAGLGSGNPLTTGYSAYGSLGQYTLAVTLPKPNHWLPITAGNFSWNSAANWLSGIVPSGTDKIARLNSQLTGAETVSLDSAISLGLLEIGGTNSPHGFLLQDGTGGPLTFDVTTGNATLLKIQGTNDIVTARISLVDDLVVSNASIARLTLSGPISGSRALTKSGNGLVALGGTNTYTGSTVIAKGTLALNANAKFTGNAFFELLPNTVLDASTLSGGLSLNAGQTLAGVGTVLGDLTFSPNSTLRPGSSNVIGTLTFSNQLTLGTGSTTTMKISRTPFTNDLVRSSGTLNFNGTLVITNLAGTLVAGDSFPLFSAASRTGNFAAITGSAGPQRTFGFNPVNGVLHVFSTDPTNLTTVISNRNLTLLWPLSHTGWRLQVQTNGLGTNWLAIPDSATNNRFDTPIDPANGSVFYRLVYP